MVMLVGVPEGTVAGTMEIKSGTPLQPLLPWRNNEVDPKQNQYLQPWILINVSKSRSNGPTWIWRQQWKLWQMKILLFHELLRIMVYLYPHCMTEFQERYPQTRTQAIAVSCWRTRICHLFGGSFPGWVWKAKKGSTEHCRESGCRQRSEGYGKWFLAQGDPSDKKGHGSADENDRTGNDLAQGNPSDKEGYGSEDENDSDLASSGRGCSSIICTYPW